MDWGKMFNNEKVESPYADMFGAEPAPKPQPKSNMADLFAKEMSSAPVKAVPAVQPIKQNFAGLANSLYSPEEQKIMQLNPSANPTKVIEWNKAWDNRFSNLSEINTKISNNMLDLTQDFAREHTKQTALFENIQNQIRIVDELFTPQKPQNTGLLGKIFGSEEKPRVITDTNINVTVDKVQKTLNSLHVRVDPFVDAQLSEVMTVVEKMHVELESAVISLDYLKDSIDPDLYNRRYLRLEALKKIVELSVIGVDRLATQSKHRIDVLEDFKLQAVPMVLLKLQQFIINKDATQMQGAFDSLLNLRLE